MKRAAVASVALVVVLAGCGGGGSKSAAAPTKGTTSTSTAPKTAAHGYVDAAAVHDAMASAGIDCADFQVDSTDGVYFGPRPISSGSCKYLQEDVSIDVYKNVEIRGDADGMASKAGCSIAEEFGITRLTWVSVENVTVTGESSDTAKAVHAKFGGSYHDIKC